MMDIITQKMVFGGKSLANFEGKTVFVPFALPGEKLRVETTKSARDYDEAKIVEILEPSPHRVEPPCPLYQKCGGCNFMHIESAYQKTLKEQIVKDIFLRAGIELTPVKTIAKNDFAYRARMELHDGGMQERSSNQTVPIDQCPIATPEINEFLKTKSRLRGRTMVFGSGNAEPRLTAVELGSRQEEVGSRKARNKNLTPSHFTLTPVTLALCGKKIVFDAKGFFQSNIEVLEEAIPIIMQEIRGQGEEYRGQDNAEGVPAYCLPPTSYSFTPSHLPLQPFTIHHSLLTALDLYSGSGTFSVFLADIFAHVTMVEHNKGAAAFAEQNMAGKPHSTYAISGANFVKYHADKIAAEQGQFALAFADPPRSGMEKEVCEWLCKSGIPAIAYLSCDPSTQARDVAKLAQSGYNIKAAYLLDFYPQTSHIETFLLCIKK